MREKAQELLIGRVIKPHGIRGEVAVEPSTDHPEIRFARGATLTGRQTGKERTLTIATTRPHQQRLLLSFEEIPDRTAAETLRGMKFFAPPLEDPEDDGYYDHELEGLRVLNVGNTDAQTAHARAYEGQQPEPVDIGVVAAVQHGPAGTILDVALDDKPGHHALIPFRHAIVPIVDLDNDAIVITPPEGLLEL